LGFNCADGLSKLLAELSFFLKIKKEKKMIDCKHFDRMIQEPISFSKANSKLKKLAKAKGLYNWTKGKESSIYSWDLLAGWSCPFAHECRSSAVEGEDGKRKVVDGVYTKFRCYAASQEARLTNVYQKRKRNYDAMIALSKDNLVSDSDIAGVLCDALPFCGLVRIHSSGDFFSWKYFSAWMQVCKRNPRIKFYAYTKALVYVRRYETVFGSLPENFSLVASRGGSSDNLITPEMAEAVVVYSEEEAEAKGLEMDTDDSHAAIGGTKFALLIHGTQPKGSEAQKALVALKGAKK